MLVTADRNFFNYPFWNRAIVTGARLLFRARANQRLPRETELADGSCLTTFYATDKDRRHQDNGAVVRVIEYALDGIPDPEPSYRLVTNWLDSNAAFPRSPLFPPEHRQPWINSILAQIASGLACFSRGLRNPRGVKRKMSNSNLR
jgi:hypothetical protein